MKKFAMYLQVLVILFALAVVPASAVDGSAPTLPLILAGNVEVDGESAPVGTEIVVKLNDEIVGQTEVSLEGVYGDTPLNRLLVTCLPEDYGNLTFYVNDVESDLVDPTILETASPGVVMYGSTITVSGGDSIDDGGEGEDVTDGAEGGDVTDSSSSRSSSGSGGFAFVPEDNSDLNDDVIVEEEEEESVSEESLKSPTYEQSAEVTEEVPVTEEKSSVGDIGLLAIGLIILIGAIATIKYMSKK